MEDFLYDVLNQVENYYYTIVRITPKLGLGVVVLLAAWFIAAKMQQFSNRRLQSRMRDPLLANFIARLVKVVLLVIGFLIVLRIIGLNGIASSLLAGAGISAFVIGFALKDIGENFLAGILLAFKRPFKIGDMIESNGIRGKVIALNLRDTQVQSEGKDIFIPNALLVKNPLINFNSEGFLLQDFTVGIAYQSDYQKAIDLITDALSGHDEVTNDGQSSSAVVTNVNGTAVQLLVRYWVKSDLGIPTGKTKSKVIIKVLNILKDNGFEIKKD